ncbi:hypothetical protein WHR41_06666 [Cladosporium halotolerans]|uniref:Secretory phospholipase A2 n=1 Tax=Cladosporium halotolerans TaxID=1052096 RepID=A0AB34KMN6_9PEZI
MKVLALSIVFNLLSSATALPTVPDLPKDIDLPGFAESLGFNSIEQVEQALSAAVDDDGEPETRSLEERAVGQCTLRRIKEVMFDFSITQFENERNAHGGKDEPKCLNWSSDNCSFIWDRPAGFNFIPACHRHDFGTRNFKRKGQWNIVNKVRTDVNFREDMYRECAKYKGLKNVLKKAACVFLANQYADAVAKIPLFV